MIRSRRAAIPPGFGPGVNDHRFIRAFKSERLKRWNFRSLLSLMEAADLGALLMAAGDWAGAAQIGEAISVHASPRVDYKPDSASAIHQAAYAYRQLGRAYDERRMYLAAPAFNMTSSRDIEVHQMEVNERMQHLQRLGTDAESRRHLFTAIRCLCGELAEIRTGEGRAAWLQEGALEGQLSEALKKLRAGMDTAQA